MPNGHNKPVYVEKNKFQFSLILVSIITVPLYGRLGEIHFAYCCITNCAGIFSRIRKMCMYLFI